MNIWWVCQAERIFVYVSYYWVNTCHAPLHEECLQHDGHKGDPRVTPGTCGTMGERAQVILVWVRAPGVENTSHPRRLGITRVRPWALGSSWRLDSRMLKNFPIRSVSQEIWQFEWGVAKGHCRALQGALWWVRECYFQRHDHDHLLTFSNLTTMTGHSWFANTYKKYLHVEFRYVSFLMLDLRSEFCSLN